MLLRACVASVCACLCLVRSARAGDDVVLPPTDKSGTPVGFVFVQGASIPCAAYSPLLNQVQKEGAAQGLSVWAVALCLPFDTPIPYTCSGPAQRGVKELSTAGLPEDAPLVYGAHSLGTVCLQQYLANEKSPTANRTAGMVLTGGGLLRASKYSAPMPTLQIAGSLDGLYRIFRVAEAFYHQDLSTHNIAVVEGLNHMQIASGTPPSNVKKNDLKSTINDDDAHKSVASLIASFLKTKSTAVAEMTAMTAASKLDAAYRDAAAFFEPITAALNQEAFIHFEPACDSDYPMPSCPDYPRYPSGQKGDTPQTGCTCGVPWVRDVAQKVMAGLPDTVTIANADAIHPVSDLNPIHLPHIWSKCSQEEGCTINVTTVSNPVYTTLDGVDTGLYEISATELKVKLKSRQSMWIAAGHADADFHTLDETTNPCRDINQLSYQWALDHAGPTALARYKLIGQPLVFGNDSFISNAGPVWIENPLKFSESSDKSMVTVTAPCSHTDVNYTVSSAAGFHYCKLLSPARAMEWIYIDGLRAHGSI